MTTELEKTIIYRMIFFAKIAFFQNKKMLSLHYFKNQSKMRKITLISTCFIVFFVNLHTVFGQLSKDAKMSVLTCGAGFEFFEAFGHTALRVSDSALGMDYVFNWGLFDFSTDNFYLKFAQGRLPYMLGISTYEGFVAEYQRDGRSMYEQELRLTDKEKEILYEALVENYKPENRCYNYDFFEDNCATRVRDIVQNSLQDRRFPTEIKTNSPLTFRQLYLPYTHNHLWWRFAIDIALGMRADRRVSTYEYMYLPDDLMNQFDTTILAGSNETLSEPRQIILEEQCAHSTPTVISPNLVFWLLLIGVVVVSFFEIKKGFYAKGFDIVFFTLIFVLSILVFYLSLISDHNATKCNLNLLWTNPLLFYALIRLRKSAVAVLYVLLACLAVLIVGFWAIPQHFNPAFFPIWLILALRLTLLLFRKKRKKPIAV